jgi:hypothetical protein
MFHKIFSNSLLETMISKALNNCSNLLPHIKRTIHEENQFAKSQSEFERVFFILIKIIKIQINKN